MRNRGGHCSTHAAHADVWVSLTGAAASITSLWHDIVQNSYGGTVRAGTVHVVDSIHGTHTYHECGGAGTATWGARGGARGGGAHDDVIVSLTSVATQRNAITVLVSIQSETLPNARITYSYRYVATHTHTHNRHRPAVYKACLTFGL